MNDMCWNCANQDGQIGIDPSIEYCFNYKPIATEDDLAEGWTDTTIQKGSAVDHPSHYQGKIEVIDFIEDKGLGFHLGNAIKYISRAGRKSPETEVEDLRKAIWYIERYIERKGAK